MAVEVFLEMAEDVLDDRVEARAGIFVVFGAAASEVADESEAVGLASVGCTCVWLKW